MTKQPDTSPIRPRLLPGIIIALIQWFLWIILPALFPGLYMYAVMGGTLGGLAFLVWWLFFSRLPMKERWGSLLLMALSVFLFSFLIHESVDTGNMGLMYYMYVIPNICLFTLLAVLIGNRLPAVKRRLILAVFIILAPGVFVLLRSDGLNGEGRAMLNWRWAETDEDRLLAGGELILDAKGPLAGAGMEAEWPGFRGPGRNSVVAGPDLQTDWNTFPPEQLWKQPVGPACSSFAIRGDRVYTQEQRGELELVTCYNIHTGGLIWKHQDEARFYDSHAGAGPRATPAIEGNSVYTLGGTGILNALDAETGELIWSRNAASEQGIEALTWGFCASPLVVDNAVIIALFGRPAAYHKDSGELLWEGTDGGNSYSSPQLFTIRGIPQILLMSRKGCTGMDPASGKTLWVHEWEISDRILQPALTGDGKLLLNAEMTAFRCVEVTKNGNKWSTEIIWTTEEIKQNFNDFVVHEGHAYGFDGPSLTCVDLENGSRTWKGKRYRGWTLLLPGQDLLLILSEKGELILAEANPGQFNELANLKVIEGRTWNHPAMAGDIILVRNAREMAAYRLALK